MRLKEISRTATFAWSPSSSGTSTSGNALPLIATGTVSGALDETFSNVGHLEIWAPFEKGGEEGGFEVGKAKACIDTNARFNRLAWSQPLTSHPRGVLAAGLETGEINVWDVEKIMGGGSASDSLIFKNDTHTGPVRGLDFNPISGSVFASGGINAELQIFDLLKPNVIHNAGPPSTKLTEITAVQWNPQVQHILASSSSSGFTSVWDLRARREVIGLQYGGGAATGQIGGGGGAGMQVGSRRGMSDVCWQPDTSTRLITSSEDDTSPIIMVWDLRNSRAPEKILTGHDKGVLSVSWCKQDPDMLLSCGKDNRTIVWNPQTCEIIGELPSSTNWSFQTAWCPRNPDILATASFDGQIGIHSLQGTQETTPAVNGRAANEQSSVDDIFGAAAADQSESVSAPAISLKQPPKWLKRPVSAAFGFGGQLVSVSNLAGATGKNQSRVVHIREVVTESDVLERAKKLDSAAGSKAELGTFCEEMSKKEGAEPTAGAGWKALRTLFDANSREELVTLLGFSKEEIAAQVAEAIKNYKPQGGSADDDEEAVPGTPRDPAVTFAEKTEEMTDSKAGTSDADGTASAKGMQSETTPSETSTTANQTEISETTEPSLFGGEHDDGGLALGTPQTDAGAAADFFSSMATVRGAIPAHMDVPHSMVPKDSSVAATIGSRASSVVSDNMKSNTFKIYPVDESEVDRLITRALVLGDFESAVTLSLSADRFADALILAVRGGPDLLAKTQKAYFERRTTQLPFLRLFQSIVSNDLTDIVQNADLAEWQEIFVVLCTFARPDEFNNLAEQLGQRIEFRYRTTEQADSGSKEQRKNALLCYLAAGKLEKAVNIWIDELKEDEHAAVEAAKEIAGTSRYSARATALQTFIEKIAVFQAATGYSDKDLAQPTRSEAVAESGARSYRLAALYDRYYEYADLLATQGMIDLAVKYIRRTPEDYQGQSAGQGGFKTARDRYLGGASASSGRATTPAATQSSSASKPTSLATPMPYGIPPPIQPPSNAPASYSSYGPTTPAPVMNNQPTNAYGSVNGSTFGAPPHPVSTPYATNNYGGSNYGAPAYGPTGNYGQPATSAAPAQLPPPPMGRPKDLAPPPIPAAQRRDIPGWNDAPSLANPKRPTSAAGTSKPQPISSPFPESQMTGPPQTPPIRGDQTGFFGPPPSRSNTNSALPPPPPRASGPPPARANVGQGNGAAPPPTAGPRPPSQGGPPPGAIAGPPPPSRTMSPLVPPGARVMSPPIRDRAPSSVSVPQTQPTPAPSPYQPAPASSSSGPYGPPANRGPVPPIQPRKASTPQPAAPAPRAPQPAPPKYPAGDRSHIPPTSQPIFEILANEVGRLKHVVPPQQRKFIDDTEKRLNLLFDELNCETVPEDILQGLSALVQAIRARDMQGALNIHVQILTQGNKTPNMGSWMTGLKQLVRIGM